MSGSAFRAKLAEPRFAGLLPDQVLHHVLVLANGVVRPSQHRPGNASRVVSVRRTPVRQHHAVGVGERRLHGQRCSATGLKHSTHTGFSVHLSVCWLFIFKVTAPSSIPYSNGAVTNTKRSQILIHGLYSQNPKRCQFRARYHESPIQSQWGWINFTTYFYMGWINFTT